MFLSADDAIYLTLPKVSRQDATVNQTRPFFPPQKRKKAVWPRETNSGTSCSWHFVLHHCFTPSYVYLPILLALHFAFCIIMPAEAMQSCLLAPFKCVNTKATGLYAIIFDSLYRSLILSSLLSTLGFIMSVSLFNMMTK